MYHKQSICSMGLWRSWWTWYSFCFVMNSIHCCFYCSITIFTNWYVSLQKQNLPIQQGHEEARLRKSHQNENNQQQRKSQQNLLVCFPSSVFGCEKKIRREKEVRENKERKKEVRNRVDLRYCLVQVREKRNREEKNVDYFWKYNNVLEKKIFSSNYFIFISIQLINWNASIIKVNIFYFYLILI